MNKYAQNFREVFGKSYKLNDMMMHFSQIGLGFHGQQVDQYKEQCVGSEKIHFGSGSDLTGNSRSGSGSDLNDNSGSGFDFTGNSGYDSGSGPK